MDSRENLADPVSEAVAFSQGRRDAGDAPMADVVMIEAKYIDGSLLSLEKPLLSVEDVADRLTCPSTGSGVDSSRKAPYLPMIRTSAEP